MVCRISHCLLYVLKRRYADTARFGYSYLAKFGWNPSKGLGDGAGQISHVQVTQKQDFLGIGAHLSQDPDTACKQNDDFEHLLKKLNAESEREVTVKENDEEPADFKRAAKRRRKPERNSKSRTNEARRKKRTHERLCCGGIADRNRCEDSLVVVSLKKALKLGRTTAAQCRSMPSVCSIFFTNLK
jgi:hypothetical protein